MLLLCSARGRRCRACHLAAMVIRDAWCQEKQPRSGASAQGLVHFWYQISVLSLNIMTFSMDFSWSPYCRAPQTPLPRGGGSGGSVMT